MRNKILIVDSDLEVHAQFDKILQKIVEEGGELIFATRREEALKLIKNEHPQIVFIEAFLAQKIDLEIKGVRCILMRKAHEPEIKDSIAKPLKSHQVLELCREVLTKEVAPRLPPM